MPLVNSEALLPGSPLPQVYVPLSAPQGATLNETEQPGYIMHFSVLIDPQYLKFLFNFLRRHHTYVLQILRQLQTQLIILEKLSFYLEDIEMLYPVFYICMMVGWLL